MSDPVTHLADVIREAAARKRALCIRGGGTKDFYGGEPRGDVLDTKPLRGIVSYEPTELVITARAGTPLEEIETALREKGQQLAFEPPHFDYRPAAPSATGPGGLAVVSDAPQERIATLGGCVAAGLSGPRRAYAGAVRDFILGVRIMNGNGEALRFGGEVMKNVAGYDLSRLTVGALGTLGVILEVSLKVLPIPASEATLKLAAGPDEAIKLMNQWAGKPLPVTATAYRAGSLAVRLSGSASAVSAAVKKMGGEAMDADQAARFWSDVREHRAPFFAGDQALWRLSVKPTTPPMDLAGPQMIEWSGALRWLRSDADAGTIRGAAAHAGGHATLFRAAHKTVAAFHPLSPALESIHRRLKAAFDPAGILNPGRLYPDF
ncbi:MAG TPA: glycolate oxidase subunit GlcE [Burkholderiales bacterium]|jgi:glycolate oxidase FAD binding subunit|nr:glycolate oxidase subunit GlcE [Burkholderiales bacterium]